MDPLAQLEVERDGDAVTVRIAGEIDASNVGHLAQEIRREGDLYYHAHHQRWHHSPRRWTAAQSQGAREFLQNFIRPDGTPDPTPLTRKGKWRL